MKSLVIKLASICAQIYVKIRILNLQSEVVVSKSIAGFDL